MAYSSDDIVRFMISQRGQLLGYIWSIVHDEHLAEDVFQDVFIVVCRKSKEIEIADEAHLFRWIRKVARFESLNAARKSKRSPLVFQTEIHELHDVEWANADAYAEERAEALRICTSKLSAYAERLIRLRYVEKLSGKALAERVNRKVSTVYTALSRIHAALRECVNNRLGATNGG